MTTQPQASRSGSGHERKDADVVSLALIAGMMLLCGVIVYIATWGLMQVLTIHRNKIEQPPSKVAAQRRDFPVPRLQPIPQRDLAKFAAQQTVELHSYGWIDQKAGVVRIPIDRAMQMVLERGLPEVGGGQTPLSLMQARSQQIEKAPVNSPAKP
jgi:hypothetical protein